MMCTPRAATSAGPTNPPSRSVQLGQQLRLRLSVRPEACLVALRPGRALLRAANVPIGTAALKNGTQVQAQLLHGGPAEEPVAVVDLVDAQAGLEHNRVRDHRIVLGVGVLRDV